ncbi:MAG TPA: ABC transporter permease, partial [Bacteroidales bacterium]|nr:ABC transporter permease [Bacteroidales bacterium]
MINKTIKTTLRNIRKHRILSVINILGLTIGLSAVILIGIYVRHEISFDRFHENAENIYRIERKGVFDGNEFHLPHTNNLIPPAMQDEFPSVINFVRIWPTEVMLQDSRNHYQQEEIYLADASFFEMFSFPLIEGDPQKVLTNPYSAVLTKEMAGKYFGTTDVVGQSMEVQAFDSTITLTVQGLMENMPENSHLQSGMIVSYKTAQSLVPQSMLNTWVGNYLYSYIQLEEDTDLQQLTAQFPSFIKKYMRADFKRMLGDDVQVSKMLNFHLQPLTDIYLYARLDYAIGPTGDINKIYTAVGIALLILIIACINYINLSTAKSMTRAREVGLRKVFGAHRRKVILQFIAESVVLAIIALLLSMIVVESLLPTFNSFLLKDLSIGYLRRPEILLILAGSAVLIGTLAGVYPALYISSYRPVSILKGTDHSSPGSASGNIRKGLVIFQFAISVGLLISVFTMNRQLNFMVQKDLGFDEKKTMVV